MMGAKPIAPIVVVFDVEIFKSLLRVEEHLHYGCITTTLLMLSRSSSKLEDLQTTMGTFPALLPICSAAGHHQFAKGV